MRFEAAATHYGKTLEDLPVRRSMGVCVCVCVCPCLFVSARVCPTGQKVSVHDHSQPDNIMQTKGPIPATWRLMGPWRMRKHKGDHNCVHQLKAKHLWQGRAQHISKPNSRDHLLGGNILADATHPKEMLWA